MTPKQATRRYFSVFAPSMTVYMLGVFLAVYLIKNEIVAVPMTYAVALIPGVAAVIFMWSHFRFMKETDEFHRKVGHDAMLFGTFCVLFVAMTWGMVEMFADLAAIPIFYVIPIFYGGYGVAAWRQSRKYKISCTMIL